MEVIADFHIHSRFAMACSKNITLQGLDAGARQKGIKVIGTGDFTHPLWLDEIKRNLVSAEKGLWSLNGSKTGTRFALTTEVSTIFERNGKSKKMHNCIVSPTLEVVEQINEQLGKYGSLQSDGRPALSMSASELVEIVHGIDNGSFIFPAHSWTPWFGALGSFSGFDSIAEAYEDMAKNIYAIESGLSADPSMCWRLSSLDKYAVISNSDPHSIPKIGREANVFEFGERELSLPAITDAIKKKDRKHFKMTIEFYPEEGKYHYDGHRNCGTRLSPDESRKYNGRCPVCGKKATIGVLHRVEELADRPEGYVPANAIPFVHVVPLSEVLSYVTGKGDKSMYVQNLYSKLIDRFGSEFNTTMNASIEQIAGVDKDLASAIGRIREEKVHLIPGYDGEFGVVDIMNKIKEEPKGRQQSLM
ncbi:MAG: DNA helicase UvrD [Candidatus Micrarchaeota archaeon]|nr:DNA helicase UvrD [Candidatus Micrarchaeota archaeon]MDE1804980.1 DNA helicase UvrD [Candidatus Micrarchaeota archaeon]MDE1846739.1 DNA helicase UvrD [Candidatus Micrarchaeota archaeon]